MTNQFLLLGKRKFLPLFLTQYLGAFNDNLFKNALVILITYTAADHAGVSPALLVSIAAGIFILPFFLFSALAGQLADSREKAGLIRRLKVIEILLMMAAAAGFYMENIYFLLLVLFLMGTQSSFFGPLKYGILPDLLKKDELIGANALVEAATFIAILLGTIAGGLFVLKAGGIYIIAALVISIAVIGWLSSCYIPAVKPPTIQNDVNLNFISESWRLLVAVRHQKEIFRAILGISWFWLTGFVFLAYLPIYGKENLGVNEDVVTLFLTCFSLGIGLGSLLCNRLLKGKISMAYAPAGALGMGVFTLCLCLLAPVFTHTDSYMGLSAFLSNPYNIFILLDMILIAAFGGLFAVPLYTILQAHSREAFRSRTIAANNIMNAFFMVAASVGSIILLKFLPGIIELFLILAALNFIVAIFLYRRLK